MTITFRHLMLFISGCAIGIACFAQQSGKAAAMAQPAAGHKSRTWKFGNFGKNASGTWEYKDRQMIISTRNTPHCFFQSDAYSFVYLDQSFPYDDCSMFAAEVEIRAVTKGSAGIMMRSGRNLDAANVHLEATSTGELLLFSRGTDGASTIYRRVSTLVFPIDIRLVRQGRVFTAFYKDGKGQWLKGPSLSSEVDSSFLFGFYACSGSKSQIGYSVASEDSMNAVFSGWKYRYAEHYIPAEKDFLDKMPVKPGTLLRDNFNDGSLSNTPESVTNPVWEGIKYGWMPVDKAGGRFWRKRGDGLFFLGGKKWADYQVNIDLTFAPGNPIKDEFLMRLRYQNISVYAKMARYYAISFRGATFIIFEKYNSGNVVFSQAAPIPLYLDGRKHALQVRVLDRNFQVYYDHKLIIQGVDSLHPITYGNMALEFNGADMDIDNLEVLKVEDPVNGTSDNYLMDYFDRPLPAFLKEYGY